MKKEKKQSDPRAAAPKPLASGCALLDGEKMMQEHPDTFFIPDAIIRTNAQVGWAAKVGIETDESPGERVWTVIVSKEKTSGGWNFVGKIESTPIFSEGHGIHRGDHVRFGTAHILDICPHDHTKPGAHGEAYQSKGFIFTAPNAHARRHGWEKKQNEA